MDRVALPARIASDLRDWLQSHPQGHERGAIVLFREYARGGTDLPMSKRWVAVEALMLHDDWIQSSSPCHIEINLRKLPEIYLKCELAGLHLGFVHSHPAGASEFSLKDDANERNILRGYSGCNGPELPLVSLVLCEGKWKARVRYANNSEIAVNARHVAEVGPGLDIHLADVGESSAIQQRQEAAFGRPFNRKLASLRVGVVGLGGTGSPVATLLTRAGVGELIVIDGDVVEETNLNRVRGYRRTDIGHKKAMVLAKFLNGLGLPPKAVPIDKYLYESPRAIDALSGCDLIFGCTDDVLGRELMNLCAFYYGTPLIDLGLTGEVMEIDGEAMLRDHRGRVSTIIAGFSACLRCQRVVTDEKLKYEEAVRLKPELKKLDRETLRKEFYIVGGGEEAPGVGPFTSATADLGVATLMDLVRPYRELDTDLRRDNIWYDFVHLRIHSNEPAISPNCFCCGSGGIQAGALETDRLGLPMLGRLN